ncbi:hypothetical protein EYC98_14200 [Halieaceae bacterium IMCC14734]|uniref:MaoC-like domain-containing protein n=1 Tax=Candidatus Litorirhabdus singularis TaxID=2518993 RepID=A0ABT3TI98_9GAMM|nr:hypothetical protein [Candidatus Litorirhabdus singularis]MCX2982011.1 hypothetical protein [Candidatus Litorirhabdus singularis]
MTKPCNWKGTAFNTSPQSANEIHSDAMARSYGFRGGLVPGVTVSAYLTHPAVAAWGLDWLEHGGAKVSILNPTYDGDSFAVALDNVTDSGYQATLTDAGGTVTASAEVYRDHQRPAPILRGDTLLQPDSTAPTAIPATMYEMRKHGMSALAINWRAGVEMESYLKNAAAMAPSHAPTSTGPGFANTAFLLGLSNWVLADNVSMNPWIHMQTQSWNYAAVKPNTRLTVECTITDLFSRKGHEFVDVEVNAFNADNSQPVITIMLRAIYRVRAAAN